MEATEVAYIAGFMTGRGGFGLDKEGYYWLYFRARDGEIAVAAVREWGGYVSENIGEHVTTYKFTTTGEQAAKAIADMRPYFVGHKRERAEALPSEAGAAA